MSIDAALASILSLTKSALGQIAVAVSGGSDSMALLRLAAKAASAQNKPLIAATVDHGLRVEAASEAQWVKAQCADLNVAHETLHWAGDKPVTGIPAAARNARYALLAEWARNHKADRILIGHTQDDQAETVAFRIASGAGTHGAAGLRALSVCPVWPEGRGVLLARPLLDMRRTRLQEYLRSEGAEWISDPSNEDAHYARPRMRAKLAAMESHSPDIVARFAAIGAKLSQEQSAIEAAALDLLGQHLRFDQFGAGLLARAPLQSADREVRLAALSLAILAASGEPHQPAHKQVEEAWSKLGEMNCAVSLGGVRVGRLGASHDHGLLITRDAGAAAGRADAASPDDLILRPGQKAIFDGRFELIAQPDLPGPARIRALGPDARRGLYTSETTKLALKAAPAHARPALPQIFFSAEFTTPALPAFALELPEQPSEDTEKPKILARFLGEERLTAWRVSLTRGQPASL